MLLSTGSFDNPSPTEDAAQETIIYLRAGNWKLVANLAVTCPIDDGMNRTAADGNNPLLKVLPKSCIGLQAQQLRGRC